MGASGGVGQGQVVAGGGGGGSKGSGGSGNDAAVVGGGGGGTVLSGQDGLVGGVVGGAGGYLCGGNGGVGNDGQAGQCPGGGGGGGVEGICEIGINCGNGGNGAYGGGGGGAPGSGGAGGFGGGGGATDGFNQGGHGGNGGFGGGGGACGLASDGKGGTFGGSARAGDNGGGGAALGGAIFNDSGTLRIYNSTFYGNSTAGGHGGVYDSETPGEDGEDTGGAIFSRNGATLIVDSTISGNHSTVSGGAVQIYSDGTAAFFEVDDTIIANNGANECAWTGNVTHSGAGNLIISNGSGTQPLGACDGVVTTDDPQLGALQLNAPGFTPTMAIPLYSPAMSAADSASSIANGLQIDQRGVGRPQAEGWDIGAYEICRKDEGALGLQLAPCVVFTAPGQPPPTTEQLTVQVSPAVGGTTSPAAGTYQEPQNTVIPLTATPNAGYAFSGWTGGVAQPSLSSTTVTMTQAQTVTANFVVEAPPVIAKVFYPDSIVVNDTATLTFTITNPLSNLAALLGVGFTDALPAGLTVSSATTAVCAGTLTTTAPATITLAGTTVGVNGQCQFSVTVTGAVPGNYTNLTGRVSSTNGGTGNTATAPLTVGIPQTITKKFGDASIPLNGTTTLTFKLTNPAGNPSSLTGLTFTDSLPAGLAVASPNGLTNNCGGTASATAGSSTVGLSGVTLAAGKSCKLTLNVRGVAGGVWLNIVTVSSAQFGPSSPATDGITVIAPPVITKAFGAASIPVGGSTSLGFTITNPNTTTKLTGISFRDSLPSGLVAATPNGLTGTCDGGTITATKNTGTISLSGAKLAPSASCTFWVNVTATKPGTKNNTTGAISSDQCANGAPATASIKVFALPAISKWFGASSIPLNGSTSLSFTISNPSGNPTALTGIGFTDNLPLGLVVSTPNGLTGSCDSGIITATPGLASISLTGATLNAGSSCTFSVQVTGAITGAMNNTTQPITSDQTGPGGTASATLSVVTSALAPDLTITKSHSGNFTQGQTGAQYTITVKNVGNQPASGTVTVTDSLPSGLTAASISGTNWSCTQPGGPCTRSDALNANSSYPAITLKVNVAGNAPASMINSATVSGGGESNTANDTATDPTTISSGTTTVNFDSPTCPSSNVDTYGGIKWPSPWGCEKAGYTNDSTTTITWTQNITSKTFTFANPSVLTSLRAGGGSTGNITISTDQGESIALTLSKTKTMTLYQTGFTKLATTVTVQYAGGWTMELDDLTYSSAAPACTPGTVGCGWKTGDMVSYSQQGWTQTPASTTLNNFENVYTTGTLDFGGTYLMEFTSPSAILAYLPAVGPAGALTSSIQNPQVTAAGTFGGDVLALHLDVDFSDAKLLGGAANVAFGDLTLCGFTTFPALNGLNILQFESILDALLGGGSSGSFTATNIGDLDPIADDVDRAFEGGTPSTFAEQNLVNGACP